MREARNFWFGFNPKSAQEYMAALSGPNSAHIRMVSSYWEMACSFVVNGAIDANMFDQSNGEHIIVYAKMEPFLADFRAMVGPSALHNLEHVCLNPPVGIERVRAVAERIRGMAERMRTAGANS